MIEMPLRTRHDISDGWDFVRGRVPRRWLSGHGKAGENVDLPHCWNRSDTFQYGRKSYSGRGAYRRQFDLPTTPGGSGTWKLRSEGFYGFGDVWVDGRTIARVDGQYLGFDIDRPRFAFRRPARSGRAPRQSLAAQGPARKTRSGFPALRRPRRAGVARVGAGVSHRARPCRGHLHRGPRRCRNRRAAVGNQQPGHLS